MIAVFTRSALALSLMAWAAGLAQAQAQAPAGGRAQVIFSRDGQLAEGSSSLGSVGEQLYREIDDPHTGDRWFLVRNHAFPGGPGRLLLVAAARNAAGQIVRQTAVLPVIRLGDRVTVEEHTAVVDAVLEARALRPAVLGAVFEARLAIGGRVVRVVALGPGRAALQPEMGARP